jgi:hypothetical protein
VWIGRPTADVHHHHAALQLVLGDHRLRGGEHLEHQVVDVQAGLVHHLDHVLNRGGGPGDDVGVDLQAAPRHPDGVADAVLAVDGELLGQDVEDAPVTRDRDRPRCVDGPSDVLDADLATARGHRHHPAAVLRGDVAAGQADHRGVDREPGHLLGEVDRLGHRLGGAIDLDDSTLPDSPGDGLTHTEDPQPRRLEVGDGTADLGRS